MCFLMETLTLIYFQKKTNNKIIITMYNLMSIFHATFV